MTWRRECASAPDLEAAGAQFADVLDAGDIVVLSGPLGAGKTAFTKGVARGLGVRERVTSPTFTIVREHRCHNDRGIVTLHHADVYRIASLDEVLDLALGELVEESAVALVEWGELADAVFGTDVLRVAISVGDDERRTLEIDGARARRRAARLERWVAA